MTSSKTFSHQSKSPVAVSSYLHVSTVEIPPQLANVSLDTNQSRLQRDFMVGLKLFCHFMREAAWEKVLNATSTPENSAPNKLKTAGLPFNSRGEQRRRGHGGGDGGGSGSLSQKHVSAPTNTLGVLWLNQSERRPTEVIWSFITFPRVSLLSELVSFHSHLHPCQRIWIIHAICVIYVFAYSWRHQSVCAVSLPGR